ncbi:MAG: glycosyltransferase family 2 protein [Patescibacteria group bacterium]|jgi:glycosyltransferase involved in cell wall biosynthesis
MMKNIFLLVPLYNEEKYVGKFIASLLPELKKNTEIKNVVFINDGSTDTTLDIINSFASQFPSTKEFITLKHHKNEGKGSAMSTGLAYAKKNNADAVLFMDGDMQHDPKHLTQFIQKLEEFPVVFGHRNMPTEMPFLRKLGNSVANIVISRVFGINRKDILCGYIGLRRDVLSKLYWNSHGYGVETELAIEVHKSEIPFAEISIRTIYFDPNKGLNFWQAFWIFCSIPYWFFRRKNLE